MSRWKALLYVSIRQGQWEKVGKYTNASFFGPIFGWALSHDIGHKSDSGWGLTSHQNL